MAIGIMTISIICSIKFKSDSQRLAVLLRSCIAKRHSHLHAALTSAHGTKRSYVIKIFRATEELTKSISSSMNYD